MAIKTRMIKYLFSILLILTANIGYSQSVDEIIKELEGFGTIITTTNFDGSKSRQMELLDQLKATASEETLHSLLKQNKDPIVKIFSYWSLNSPKTIDLNSLFTPEDKDKQITIIRGCFVENTSMFAIFKKNIRLKTNNFILSNLNNISDSTNSNE